MQDEENRRGLGRSAVDPRDDHGHELGNLLVSIAFCLRHLRGRQSTGELEKVVEEALCATDQSIEATRGLLRTMQVRVKAAGDEPNRAASTGRRNR